MSRSPAQWAMALTRNGGAALRTARQEVCNLEAEGKLHGSAMEQREER